MKKIKIFAVVLVVLLAITLYPNPVFADNGVEENLNGKINELLGELDLSELERYLETLTEEEKAFFGKGNILEKVTSIINGDFKIDYQNFISAISALIFDGIINTLPVFAIICAITILCGILNMFKPSFVGDGIQKLIHFIGYCAVLVLLLTSFIQVIGDASSAVNSMQKQMQIVFPILLTLTATSGGSVSVAVYQPAVVFLSDVIVNLISTIVFPLAITISVITMVGGLDSEVKLNNFSALFKSVNKWVLGISITVFSVFLTVQGITSATYDGLSFKAAKYAISNTVPIVGGFLSGGFDLMIAGSVLIKNSLGSCSIILLISEIIIPFLQLLVFSLFLKLTAAVTEPIESGKISGFLASFSGVVNYFIAGILAVAFMYFITLLLLICSSNALF